VYSEARKNKKTAYRMWPWAVYGSLTEATAIARHDHERAKTPSNDTPRPLYWRLFKRARVLVKKRVDTVGWRRAAVPHYGLCRRRNILLRTMDRQHTNLEVWLHSALRWAEPASKERKQRKWHKRHISHWKRSCIIDTMSYHIEFILVYFTCLL